jgi:hypothetical protein
MYLDRGLDILSTVGNWYKISIAMVGPRFDLVSCDIAQRLGAQAQTFVAHLRMQTYCTSLADPLIDSMGPS